MFKEIQREGGRERESIQACANIVVDGVRVSFAWYTSFTPEVRVPEPTQQLNSVPQQWKPWLCKGGDRSSVLWSLCKCCVGVAVPLQIQLWKQ